jgi:hypothetical protein
VLVINADVASPSVTENSLCARYVMLQTGPALIKLVEVDEACHPDMSEALKLL